MTSLFKTEVTDASTIPLMLERFQGGNTYNFSGQSGPVPHHHHSEEFLPYF